MNKNKLEKARQYAFQNGAADIIRPLLRRSNWSIKELAEALGIKPQSLSTKLYRDRFTFHEIQMIAYLLDAKVVIEKDGRKFY